MISSPFEEWFSLSVRRNRMSFIVAQVTLLAILALVIGAVFLFQASDRARTIILLLFAIPTYIASYLLTAQRLRDFGLTGWLALLWVPANLADAQVHGAASFCFLIVLCAIPGTDGPNRYGPDPLQI